MLSVVVKPSARAKKIRITVYRSGVVVATKPLRASNLQIEKFIRAKTRWIEDKLAHFLTLPVVTPAPRKSSKKEYLENKVAAGKLVQEKLLHFNQFYNFPYNKISIRNQKTRWGSCSQTKNLNFNYKIIFLKPEQQDYIIVHELCHLAQMNHSKAFWNLVAQKIPNYKEVRKTIRTFAL